MTCFFVGRIQPTIHEPPVFHFFQLCRFLIPDFVGSAHSRFCTVFVCICLQYESLFFPALSKKGTDGPNPSSIVFSVIVSQHRLQRLHVSCCKAVLWRRDSDGCAFFHPWMGQKLRAALRIPFSVGKT